MDNFASQCPLNHRKRKPDQDDCQDSSSAESIVQPDPPIGGPSSNAPRQQWLAAEDDNLWTSPTSPQVSSPLTSQVVLNASSSKRPRIDTHDSALRTKRHSRRSPNKISPSPLNTIRHGSDIEDIGIVSTADPGPSSGSLLRGRPPIIKIPSPPRPHLEIKKTTRSESPIDFSSPHIAPAQPLITRQTLKELELDVILRNPVIRHDLLFDPGLQFRPRRKREMFEEYWNAVWREVQTGCTCVTIDTYGNAHPTVCVCHRHSGVTIAVVSQLTVGGNIYTVRMPSRIPALLQEFLEVMLFVIQPLSNTNIYSNPTAIKEQAQEHSAHAAYLRSIFDPQLIEQELKHKVFDPSGLFAQIGETLKHHCAPMRDRAVEEMVQIAQRPGPEAFQAFRICLELLELMKLDIANHQLSQLRPWLLRNTGVFEVKAFKIRFGPDASLHFTREWLHSAHKSLLSRQRPIPHPSHPIGLDYTSSTKNQKIYLSALKGIVDLVFDPTNISPPPSPINTPPASPTSSPSSSLPVFSIPETLYLDKTRLSLISSDAMDTTALYMFILLFRQLVFSEPSESSSPPSKLDQNDMMRLKREIRDIGPSCLGTCFVSSKASGVETPPLSPQECIDSEQRRNAMQDLVLQIAKRASDLRRSKTTGDHPACSVVDGATAGSAQHSTFELVPSPPDNSILTVARRWAQTNMEPGSVLSIFLHKRMRDVVFEEVVSLAASWNGMAGKSTGTDLCSGAYAGTTFSGARVSPSTTTVHAAGMDALTDEIRRLGEKIARLAIIHLNTHLSLYETDGFLVL